MNVSDGSWEARAHSLNVLSLKPSYFQASNSHTRMISATTTRRDRTTKGAFAAMQLFVGFFFMTDDGETKIDGDTFAFLVGMTPAYLYFTDYSLTRETAKRGFLEKRLYRKDRTLWQRMDAGAASVEE